MGSRTSAHVAPAQGGRIWPHYPAATIGSIVVSVPVSCGAQHVLQLYCWIVLALVSPRAHASFVWMACKNGPVVVARMGMSIVCNILPCAASHDGQQSLDSRNSLPLADRTETATATARSGAALYRLFVLPGWHTCNRCGRFMMAC